MIEVVQKLVSFYAPSKVKRFTGNAAGRS